MSVPPGRGRAPRIDLHMHSNASDGQYSPEEVLARAAAGGLDLIALTDHDLPPALPWGPHEVGGRRVHVVAAAEVTGLHAGREYHLLVYFPGAMPPAYRDWLAGRAQARAERYDGALARLGLGDLPGASAAAYAGHLGLTRHHLARALLAAGVAPTFSDAMRRLLVPGTVPLLDLPYVECIRIAREAGGWCSWAHPPLADAQLYLPAFAAAGLQGLEGLRPTLARPQRNGLKRLAARFRLRLTGGTDWHGWRDPPLGLFSVPDEHAWAWLDAIAIGVPLSSTAADLASPSLSARESRGCA